MHRQTFNMRRTKSQNLNVSRLVLRLSLSNPLKPGVKCSWGSTDWRCSKYIWVNKFHSLPGPWFNIKMSSYQYRKSHCGDKTVVRSSYLHNGISYTGKMSSLYWIVALGASYIKGLKRVVVAVVVVVHAVEAVVAADARYFISNTWLFI